MPNADPLLNRDPSDVPVVPRPANPEERPPTPEPVPDVPELNPRAPDPKVRELDPKLREPDPKLRVLDPVPRFPADRVPPNPAAERPTLDDPPAALPLRPPKECHAPSATAECDPPRDEFPKL